ncbi:MAG: hypothetical protein P1U70_24445, partial [Saprospiraceae bacterium]|nr:hypothetical protein [Saprospiraceae bacterium]
KEKIAVQNLGTLFISCSLILLWHFKNHFDRNAKTAAKPPKKLYGGTCFLFFAAIGSGYI